MKGLYTLPKQETTGCSTQNAGKARRYFKLRGKDRANIGDCKPIINIGPFGVCKVTHIPCVPVCIPWLNGKMNVLVQGLPALVNNSMTICPVGGGVIKIKNDGQ